ncbi:hypothetical protein AVEN_176005-1 [Araneus ventricosus]|uniref:Uncharacterized protein n=1 Tax=Araneus ventricosus TaxID=182803 RepID=A0A4Y2EJL3_ARAVE|nr:hypothetical protein AVEN_176005-1 [Araneus ventricosus]
MCDAEHPENPVEIITQETSENIHDILTDDIRVRMICQESLKLFKWNPNGFLRHSRTEEETWIHHCHDEGAIKTMGCKRGFFFPKRENSFFSLNSYDHRLLE